MQINIVPNLDQIRYFAQSAKHAFDFQSIEAGRDAVIADMTALLAYLDILDNSQGIVVKRIIPIKGGIRLERSSRENDILDLGHGYSDDASDGFAHPGNRDCACPGQIKSVRPKNDIHAGIGNGDLDAPSDGGAKQ